MRGGWVRFEKYEIKDGYIQPTARAAARPFRRYHIYEAAQSMKTGRRLAIGLIELEQSLDSKEGLDGFSSQDERLILDWCNEFGLLGLLTHQVDDVTLYPQGLSTRPKPVTLAKAGTRYRQVPREADPTDNTPATGTFLRRIEGAAPTRGLCCPAEWLPLSDFWGKFFVGVPHGEAESYRYPLPYNHEFWRGYREPLRDFLFVVRLLADCAKYLAMDKVPAGGSLRLLEHTQRQASESLSLLADSVRMRLAREDGGWNQVFESTSLISDIAASLIEDVAGKKLVSCEGCGKTIATDAYQQLFCSRTCAHKIRTRRNRMRNLERETALLKRAATHGGLTPAGKDLSHVERLAKRGLLTRAEGNQQRYILSPRGERRLQKISTAIE